VDGRGVQRRSTVKSTEGEPRFTGREAELRAIEHMLHAGRVVVLHGAPGLGKSRLVREYAHQHAEAYPGGMFFVPFEQPPPIELAKLLRDTDRPIYADESVEDQCRRALRDLGLAGRALLIYDAIADEHVLREWLPYDGLDWRLLVTSTSASWATSWRTLELALLDPGAARELAISILGDDVATNRLAEQIVVKAAGTTIELCASAAAVRERLRRGRTVDRISAELAAETAASFVSAWTLLSSEAQLALQVASTFVISRVPASLVVQALQRIGWDASKVEDAIDAARERKLVGGDTENIDVHQLVARFVRARAPLGESVRRSLFQGLLHAARAFSENPGDLGRRALMLAHSLELDDWAALVTEGSEWHVVGNAAADLGRFAEALPWCERAAVAKEKGDVNGRVDAESLGTSLHQVGYCYSSVGKFAEALPWCERAVAAAEKGDVHGRVDAAMLGKSLHLVGYCYCSMGKFAEALPWFERAVTAAENGESARRDIATCEATSVACPAPTRLRSQSTAAARFCRTRDLPVTRDGQRAAAIAVAEDALPTRLTGLTPACMLHAREFLSLSVLRGSLRASKGLGARWQDQALNLLRTYKNIGDFNFLNDVR
jgi:tetratricopeptide (TPR) repeat protein